MNRRGFAGSVAAMCVAFFTPRPSASNSAGDRIRRCADSADRRPDQPLYYVFVDEQMETKATLLYLPEGVTLDDWVERLRARRHSRQHRLGIVVEKTA